MYSLHPHTRSIIIAHPILKQSCSDCTPYLLHLGLTKSKTSLVWIAGPLSGLIMQPVVGAISDRSTSKYGRRRPFMIGGSVLVGVGLLLLGWTPELVGLFVSEEVLVWP
jgi:solute carrier family 45, member 1/2/4